MSMIFTPPGKAAEPGPAFLESTRFFDWETEAVRRFAENTVRGEATAIGKAIKLFYAVRDGCRYDPFSMRFTPDIYIASNVLRAKGAYCIPKANLLVAAARAVGIPTAIGLSDVVNHLTTEKLKERLGGLTYFMHHGYAVMHLEGQWVKAAPAFNIELCTRFGVRPTEFDGRSDALFQEFDTGNRRHMEYVKDHGTWSEFPFEKVIADFRAFYPPTAFGEEAGTERFEDGVPVR
jgi:transglutaminase-like putative cysteine protease